MLEKLSCCDVGESCDSVAESAQVHAVDTPDYLLLERVVGRVIFPENGLLGGENTSEMSPGGMTGFVPGLTGCTKATALSVLTTAGEKARARRPSCTSPRLDCTEASFALSCKFS